MEQFLIKVDYFFLNNYHRLPFVFWKYFEFPTKRLLEYCWSNFDKNKIEYKYEKISHMYTFDSTVTKDNLIFIDRCYGPITRERIRQILIKFVKMYY